MNNRACPPKQKAGSRAGLQYPAAHRGIGKLTPL